jgi:PleD family two-component response regulator
MPEMDGIALCKSLRATKPGQRIYLIILTALEDEDHLIEAFEAGVDDYIVKPLNERVIKARLRAGQRVIRLQEEIEREREEIRRYAAELAVTNRRLQEAALTDMLTALPNRRYGMDRMEQEWAAAKRSGGRYRA